jgi:serine protease Do
MSVRYVYSVTSALLLTGSIVALVQGNPVTAQTAVGAAQGANLAPRGAPNSFADLAEQLQPAVVNIATKQKIEVVTGINPFTGERSTQKQEQASGGSGFIISADGYIVTNNHVIAGGPKNEAADSVTVKLTNGTEYKATIVGRDVQSDIAVLKINGTKLPYVEMGSSTKSRVGEWVIAIGNPLGLGSTVTAGIISALQRNIGAGGAYDRFIQTDTAINPGNSGGPLFNLDGKVVGINNRLISPTGANIGVGFAIPVDEIKNVVDSLRKGARPQRGYLGIQIRALDAKMADALGIPQNRGEVIGSVVPNEGAAKAGLMAEDIVMKVAGLDVSPDQTLSYIVANTKPGTKIRIDILREGKAMAVNAVVGERPTEEKLASAVFNPKAEKDFDKGSGGASTADADAKTLRDALGIAAIPMDAQIARDLRMSADVKGAVIDIAGNGSAAQVGLQRGDVIVSANYKPTPNPAALAAAIKAAKAAGKSAIYLGVKRYDSPTQYATIPLDD